MNSVDSNTALIKVSFLQVVAMEETAATAGRRRNAGSKWKRDLTAWVPPSEFANFTHEEKQKRYDAKVAKKLSRSVNATQTQASTTVTTNGKNARQVSGVTTAPTICEIVATQTQQGLPRGTYTSQ